ncbi:glycoside hydrolase family 99-like domain-containing protein [Methylomicrobium sp. Wu6]|nr:glycoside hydrolase family 99-like domain-containing protein [Methylomicrobium sp. Wu6]
MNVGEDQSKHKPIQTEVGVFYFPGWHSKRGYWNDIKGLPGSRSPNVPWPDREPLLGLYAEEDVKVAEQHIEWANKYGVTFFAYDWYWEGKAPSSNHAIENFLKASNNSKLKFSMLWANHSDVPRNLKEFDDMVSFWLKHYLGHPQYYRMGGKPVVFVFTNGRLEINAKKFGWSAKSLLDRADEMARKAGLSGIFFVATNDTRPSDSFEANLIKQGFSAYTGWCNIGGETNKPVTLDYQVMVDAYLDSYDAAAKTKGEILYFPPTSSGRDSRPWLGSKAHVRADASPMKFRSMLQGAKALIDSHKKGVMPLVMIQSWNEWAEGAYIEPSKKWGFEYLNTIKDVLGKCGTQIGQPCAPSEMK